MPNIIPRRATPITVSSINTSSIPSFVKVITKLTSNEIAPYWFRGVGKASRRLEPGLYRHHTITEFRSLLALEREILQRFKERSRPYLDRDEISNWENLFIMQHYGVPTRLLDWTENPMIALYFALTGARRSDFSEDAAVWCISPSAWNKVALAESRYEGGPVSINGSHLKSYEPTEDTDRNPLALPVAMYGVHNSPRIIAQRGVFLIFGERTEPMEVIMTEYNFHNDSLVKIIVKKKYLKACLKQLYETGYGDAAIFPSLEGVASEIINQFKFEAR